MKKNSGILISIIFTGMIVSDFLTLYFSFFGKIGTIFWYLGFLSIGVFSLLSLKNLFILSFSKKSFFSLLAFFTLFGLIIFHSSQISNISGETTQQTACIIKHLENSKDWGFHQPCFLGYPARQYLISAFPSIIFRRSQMALNLGGAIYLLTGLVIFLSGFFKKYSFNQKTDLVGAIIIASLLNFHYFNHFLFMSFEQSIFPLSLGFLSLGLLLHLKKKFRAHILALLGISLIFIISAYTPSLALGTIVAFYLFISLFSKKINLKNKIFIIIILISTLTSFFISQSFRDDINFLAKNKSQSLVATTEIFNLGKHLFIQTTGRPFFTSLFSLVVIVSLFSPFLSKQKLFFPIPLWIIFTTIVGVLSQGYSFYSLDFRIHRALVVVPFLLFVFGDFLIKNRINNMILKVFLILVTLTGWQFSHNYLSSLPPQKHLTFINWLSTMNIKNTNSTIYFIGKSKNDFISLNDELGYFYPNLEAIIYDHRTNVSSCNPTMPGYYVVESSDPCFKVYTTNKDIISSKAFKDTTNNNLFLFSQNEKN